MHPFYVQSLLLLAIALASLAKSKRPELAVISIYIAMLVIDHIYHFASGYSSEHVTMETTNFVLDVVAFGAVLFLLFRIDRWWVVWVGSAQFLAVASHLLKLIDSEIPPQIYNLMEKTPVWIAIFLTGLSTIQRGSHQKGGKNES